MAGHAVTIAVVALLGALLWSLQPPVADAVLEPFADASAPSASASSPISGPIADMDDEPLEAGRAEVVRTRASVEPDRQPRFTVTGCVLDEETRQPVDQAEVRLVLVHSLPTSQWRMPSGSGGGGTASTTQSGADGSFVLELQDSGSLIVAHPKYVDRRVQLPAFSDELAPVNIGTIVMRARPVLTCTVVEPDGTPVEDASLFVRPLSVRIQRRGVRGGWTVDLDTPLGKTDRAGRFPAPLNTFAAVEVLAFSPNHVPKVVSSEAGASIEIVLEPGPPCRVALLSADRINFASVSMRVPEHEVALRRTMRNGEPETVSFGSIWPSRADAARPLLYVHAESASGRFRAHESLSKPASLVTIELVPHAGCLDIRWSQGDSGTGCLGLLHLDGNDVSLVETRTVLLRDRAARLHPPRAGRYKAVLYSPATGLMESSTAELAAAGTMSLDLHAVQTPRMGRVVVSVTAGGIPAAASIVTLSFALDPSIWPPGPVSAISGHEFSMILDERTDRDGRAVFAMVPMGPVVIEAHVRDHAVVQRSVQVVADTHVELTALPGSLVRGSLAWPKGGAQVPNWSDLRATAMQAGAVVASSVPDSAGQFVLGRLSAGTYEIVCRMGLGSHVPPWFHVSEGLPPDELEVGRHSVRVGSDGEDVVADVRLAMPQPQLRVGVSGATGGLYLLIAPLAAEPARIDVHRRTSQLRNVRVPVPNSGSLAIDGLDRGRWVVKSMTGTACRAWAVTDVRDGAVAIVELVAGAYDVRVPETGEMRLVGTHGGTPLTHDCSFVGLPSAGTTVFRSIPAGSYLLLHKDDAEWVEIRTIHVP